MLSEAAKFEAEHWIAADRDRVFRFFADPRNLPVITPRWTGAQLVRLEVVPPRDIGGGERMAAVGSLVEVSLRLLPFLPLRVRWTAQIVGFHYGQFFRDQQTRGPFALWVHVHSFEDEVRDGQRGTLVRDEVDYEIGFGPLGQLADALAVNFMVRGIFQYRQRAAIRALTGVRA
ncbi:MAG TPA: SRPBCC family protein [Terriglobales bacterium]|nr:SRPBCC family protein [Terriglobales bacterium]